MVVGGRNWHQELLQHSTQHWDQQETRCDFQHAGACRVTCRLSSLPTEVDVVVELELVSECLWDDRV